LHVPGFIDNVMDYTLQTAPYPEPVLAFGGALALQSFLAARKVRDALNNRSSVYILGLANSGAGKNHPRSVAKRILFDAGLGNCVGDSTASGEGLEDVLFVQPAFLLQLDEMDSLLQAIKLGKEPRYEMMIGVLLKLYTTAHELYPMRLKAGKEHTFIDQPGLTLFGTAVPRSLYESMSVKMLANGFFARLLILEAGKRAAGREPSMAELPKSLTQVAQWWAQFQPGEKRENLQDIHPVPKRVNHTPDAALVFAEFRDSADRDYAAAEARDDQAAMAIWNRAHEKARRLALNYACSGDYQNPIIGADAARWACDFIHHQTRRMLFMAGAHVSENEFDAKCKRFVEVLRKWKETRGEDWMPFWQLGCKLKGWNPRDHEEVRKTLVAQGVVEPQTTTHAGSGRVGEAYRLRAAS
jgi:hypothetical protein